MAITEQNILANLKTYYKDGVENLLWRNSPVLKKIGKTKVEGKEYRFSAIYGAGGAVSSKATLAAAKAANNAKNAEFICTYGQRFSIFTYNAQEILASKTKKGAYMKSTGRKAFAAAEALRKVLASDFYGRGYGEMGVLDATAAATIAAASSGDVVITVSKDLATKLAVDMDVVLKTSVSSGTENGVFTVKAKNGTSITLTVVTAYASAAAGNVVCLRGSMDGSGNRNAPVGLDGWLPIVEARDNAGSVWPSFIATPFMGVNRSVDVQALAGQFVYNTNNTTKKADIEELMQNLRDAGSEADLIAMNPQDWRALADEIQSTNTYFTQTSTRAKRSANIGLDKLSASFSTNFIDLIYDDPYCPMGKFYILETEDVQFFAMTNGEAILDDKVAGNNPGTQNPEEFNNKGNEDDPYKLLIDDFISIAPGSQTDDGDATRVTYNVFGTYVLLNQAHSGVGIFHDYTAANVLGYAA